MGRHASAIQRIESLISPSIESLGYEVVQTRLLSRDREQILQIMAEPIDNAREMTVEDCAKISRHVSAVLDVEDPIAGAYRLEISSPGIDRPLVRMKDYVQNIGRDAAIEMEVPINGRRRFRGKLLGVDEHKVQLQVDEEAVELERDGIHHAKLVLTDELIAMHLKKHKK